VSRAIFLVDEALKQRRNPPRILLTTYNENLTRNIRRIFEHKLPETKDRQRYKDAIIIQSIPTWLRLIVQDCYGELPDNQTETALRNEVEDILKTEPDRYRRFDYLFIDEIQDFDNFFLIVAQHLCHSQNFFFVGDIGQKIYDRTHQLERLGIIPRRVVFKKT
jgi:DNA helicase IV